MNKKRRCFICQLVQNVIIVMMMEVAQIEATKENGAKVNVSTIVNS